MGRIEVPLRGGGLDLGKAIRNLFEPQVHILDSCVGLNTIFVRAKGDAEYTAKVPASDRGLIRAFCLSKVAEMVDLIQPERMIVIGIKAMDMLGASEPDLRDTRGNSLTRIARFAGREGLGIKHLTGARISTEDMAKIRARVRGFGRLD